MFKYNFKIIYFFMDSYRTSVFCLQLFVGEFIYKINLFIIFHCMYIVTYLRIFSSQDNL